MYNVKKNKLKLEKYNLMGEFCYNFIDVKTNKPLVNSVGKIIDVFNKCNLVKKCSNDEEFDQYKIIYIDQEDSSLLILKFIGYSVVSFHNEQSKDKICPVLMWTDGRNESYMSIPEMNVTNDKLIKSWEFKENESLPEIHEYMELLGL